MGILNIQPVERGESKVLLAYAGPSGTGKTLSALYTARGLVDNANEVGLLDTENGRGSFYANKLDGKFQYAVMPPPFSPKRMGEAIKEFEQKGVKALVIDSASHEWNGIGGCEDIANRPKSNGKERLVADWKTSKYEHRTKFVNALLYATSHIICCLRAQEKVDMTDMSNPISLGIQAICEKNFMYEMMASIMFEDEGRVQKHVKVPEFLKEAFGNGDKHLTIDTGRKIREWVEKGQKEDPEVVKYRSQMLIVCELGFEALKAAWAQMPKPIRALMNKDFPVYESSAKEFDIQKSTQDDYINSYQKDMITDLFKELGNRAEKEYNDILLTMSEMSHERAEEAIKYLEVLKSKGVQTTKIELP